MACTLTHDNSECTRNAQGLFIIGPRDLLQYPTTTAARIFVHLAASRPVLTVPPGFLAHGHGLARTLRRRGGQLGDLPAARPGGSAGPSWRHRPEDGPGSLGSSAPLALPAARAPRRTEPGFQELGNRTSRSRKSRGNATFVCLAQNLLSLHRLMPSTLAETASCRLPILRSTLPSTRTGLELNASCLTTTRHASTSILVASIRANLSLCLPQLSNELAASRVPATPNTLL